MSKEEQPLLKVKNLTKLFAINKGFQNINLEIYPGEVLGIVGESGSGKSVTSLSIMQLLAKPPGFIAGGSILYYPKDSDQPIDLLQLTDSEMKY